MPKVKIGNKIVECDKGENLRKVLMKNNISPHNGSSKWLNCKGLGTCGTCAIHTVSDTEKYNVKEKVRLSTPPFSKQKGFRLSCQIKVTNDITIKKGNGFWGEKI